MATKPTVLEEAQHSGEYRPCLDCPNDISRLSPKALRCKICAYNKEKERAKNYYYANKQKVLQRVKKYQQSPDGKQKHQGWRDKNPQKLEVYRDRKRQAHREKTGYNPEGRTCKKCQAELPVDRGGRAEYCEVCSSTPVRICEFCNRLFTAQGSRTRFCSDDCIEQDELAKEREGCAKLCTKCKKEKPYNEFGWHTGRKRSVCKNCESGATRSHYRSLPVEERQQRRRIQRQREKEQRANLSPEEKTLLNDKERRAQMRRKYGPEFDVDILYAEQDRKCAICKRCALLKDLEVDHDHETYLKGTMHSVRGLLCKNCNLKLVPRYENGFPSERQDWPYMNEYLARGKQP